MQLELEQLDRRYETLRIVEAGRLARLEASVAQLGQQSPVLVVAEGDRYVLVDGYQRVAVLERLGRDLVDVAVLPMEEVGALLEVWRLEAMRRRSALEDGWLLAQLIERHGLSQAQIAVRMQRSKSWVSGRLSLIRVLPESVQDAVRTGVVPPQGAARFLVPMTRVSSKQCQHLVEALGSSPISVRELERVYLAWRAGDDEQRERIVRQPWLLLKAEDAITDLDEVDAVEPDTLVRQLEVLLGIVRRLRQRLRAGVFARANTPASRDELSRTWQEATLALKTLSTLMNEELDRARSGDPHGHPSPDP